MHKCWNCGTEHEFPAAIAAYNRKYFADHLPECNVPWIRECICKELQMAYDRGYKDASPYMDEEYDNV
jgi:hypothetical protein